VDPHRQHGLVASTPRRLPTVSVSDGRAAGWLPVSPMLHLARHSLQRARFPWKRWNPLHWQQVSQIVADCSPGALSASDRPTAAKA